MTLSNKFYIVYNPLVPMGTAGNHFPGGEFGKHQATLVCNRHLFWCGTRLVGDDAVQPVHFDVGEGDFVAKTREEPDEGVGRENRCRADGEALPRAGNEVLVFQVAGVVVEGHDAALIDAIDVEEGAFVMLDFPQAAGLDLGGSQ